MTKLSAEQLRLEQSKTLAQPERAYGLLTRVLFGVMALFYGCASSWSKFKVLEVIAHVPYRGWEYVALTQQYEHEDCARREFERVQ